MPLQAIGRVVVPAAGTPAAVYPPAAAMPPIIPDGVTGFATVQSVKLQALPSNTGKIYVGFSGLVKATYANCLGTIAAPSDPIKGPFPSESYSMPFIPNGLDLSDLYIDADNSGEGVIVAVAYA
jgi:hypothetical protein